MPSSPCLVGDIGGTNARFAVAERGDGQVRLLAPQSFLCADFETAELAVDHYLARAGLARPADCVLAVAGAVTNGAVASTNGAWRISEAGLRDHGFQRARLINDFMAQALSIGALTPEHLARLGAEHPADPSLTAVVLGAGTGFGAAILADGPAGLTVIPTESGHVSFAATDEVEIELLRQFAQWHGRASVERILSGQGLADLYRGLGLIQGHEPPPLQPPAVLERAASGADPLSRETVDRFVAIYGSVAGDIALTTGARGGVYIAGGIAPRILGDLQAGAFRQRFEAKGRFAGYMAAIPTHVVVHPYAALVGAARAVPG